MRATTRKTPVHHGMTLIELLIVLVIVALLAGVAWPAFTTAVRKSRRADGTAALAQVMQLQERWRANNSSFGTTLSAIGAPTMSRSGYYTLSLTDPIDGAQYNARATAASGSSQADDTPCAVLAIKVQNGRIDYGHIDAGGTLVTAGDTCWPK